MDRIRSLYYTLLVAFYADQKVQLWSHPSKEYFSSSFNMALSKLDKQQCSCLGVVASCLQFCTTLLFTVLLMVD